MKYNFLTIVLLSFTLFTVACKKSGSKKAHEVTYFVNAPADYYFYYTNENGEKVYSGEKSGYNFGGGSTSMKINMKSGAKAAITAHKNGNGGLFTIQILVDGKVAKELTDYYCFCDDRSIEAVIP